MVDHLLTFVHISDTHIHTDESYTGDHAAYSSVAGARALVRAVNSLPFEPDFILHTGDVAYDPIPEAYSFIADIFALLHYPVYYVAGNHDDGDTLQSILMSRAQSEIVTPLHYEFEHKGVQIVCVDSNGPAQIPAGNVTAEQLAWLDRLCAAADDDRPMLVAIHHNPLQTGIPWLDDFMSINNSEAFHQILVKARHRLRGVFYGHIHQQTDSLKDGILYSSAASSWVQFQSYPAMDETAVDTGARPGFSVVTVSREQTYVRRYWFDV